MLGTFSYWTLKPLHLLLEAYQMLQSLFAIAADNRTVKVNVLTESCINHIHSASPLNAPLVDNVMRVSDPSPESLLELLGHWSIITLV
jgi:hypothetical protein